MWRTRDGSRRLRSCVWFCSPDQLGHSPPRASEEYTVLGFSPGRLRHHDTPSRPRLNALLDIIRPAAGGTHLRRPCGRLRHHHDVVRPSAGGTHLRRPCGQDVVRPSAGGGPPPPAMWPAPAPLGTPWHPYSSVRVVAAASSAPVMATTVATFSWAARTRSLRAPNKIGGAVGACMDQAGRRGTAQRVLVARASRHVATIEDPIDLRSVQRRVQVRIRACRSFCQVLSGDRHGRAATSANAGRHTARASHRGHSPAVRDRRRSRAPPPGHRPAREGPAGRGRARRCRSPMPRGRADRRHPHATTGRCPARESGCGGDRQCRSWRGSDSAGKEPRVARDPFGSFGTTHLAREERS